MPSAPALEIERKFRVNRLPDLPKNGRHLRQGYVAVEHPVSVRIRDDAEQGCLLTIKSGKGAVRGEVELPITESIFEQLWQLAFSRSLDKTRYEIDHHGHTIEVDVFHGQLDGLVLAEVEFESIEDMLSFDPPDWFGEDLTEDMRFTNVSLASSDQIPE